MMINSIPTLLQLGWCSFFKQRLTLEERNNFNIGRVIEQHRNNTVVMSELGQVNLIRSSNDDHVCW